MTNGEHNLATRLLARYSHPVYLCSRYSHLVYFCSRYSHLVYFCSRYSHLVYFCSRYSHLVYFCSRYSHLVYFCTRYSHLVYFCSRYSHLVYFCSRYSHLVYFCSRYFHPVYFCSRYSHLVYFCSRYSHLVYFCSRYSHPVYFCSRYSHPVYFCSRYSHLVYFCSRYSHLVYFYPPPDKVGFAYANTGSGTGVYPENYCELAALVQRLRYTVYAMTLPSDLSTSSYLDWMAALSDPRNISTYMNKVTRDLSNITVYMKTFPRPPTITTPILNPTRPPNINKLIQKCYMMDIFYLKKIQLEIIKIKKNYCILRIYFMYKMF